MAIRRMPGGLVGPLGYNLFSHHACHLVSMMATPLLFSAQFAVEEEETQKSVEFSALLLLYKVLHL